jgi:AI-2 transport protein TqsA
MQDRPVTEPIETGHGSGGGPTGQPFLAIIGIIALLAVVSVASPVLAPVAFALFIIALFWPLQKTLQTWLPKFAALALTLLVIVLTFFAFGYLISWGFGRVIRWAISDAARFQLLYEELLVWLEGHGIAMAALWTDYFNVGWVLRAVQQLSGRLNSTMSFWVIVLVYVSLGLLEVGDFGRKLKALKRPELGRVLLAGSIATAGKFRRYMLVRSQMSLLTGLLVWGFTSLLGLNLSGEWGVIAFALNYIPFLGPLLATVFPTAMALVQFEGWQTAVLVFAGLNLIQLVVGSYIEPRVSGSALSISPVIVLFAVFLWSWLWGVFGAFIGVPITIAILTFCAQHPTSRWLADLLGSAEPEG